MTQKRLFLITAFLAVLILIGCVTAAQTLTISGVTMNPDGTATATVMMDAAPQGVSGTTLTLSVADPTKAEIESVTFNSLADLTNVTTSLPASSAIVQESFLSTSDIPAGSTNIVLMTVTLKGLAAGSTTLGISSIPLLDGNDGSNYVPGLTIVPGSVNVVSGGQTLTISSVTMNPDGTGTATVTLDAAPLGLSGATFTLAVTDPTNAEIESWTPDSLAGMKSNTTLPASSTTIQLFYLDDTYHPDGSTNIVLGTATIKGLAAGSTTLGITSIPNLDDNHGNDYLTNLLIVPGTISVCSVPSAAFEFSPASPIAGDTVHFTDLSTGNPSSWAWDFNNDGTTDSTARNPDYTFATAGTYAVKQTVSNSQGSTFVTHDVVVTSEAAPVANFNVTATNAVGSVTPVFTQLSTGSISTYLWEYRLADSGTWTEFGSGVAAPSGIAFTNPGTYDIQLTVSNNGGSNTLTKTHVFSVATAHDYLTTVSSGTVSGDVYQSTVSPFTNNTTQTFTLPAAAVGNVQWARLYIDTYGGSVAGTYGGIQTVQFDGTTIGTETMNVPASSNSYAYPVNDHVMKVSSDYEAEYDVTGRISTASPIVSISSTAISGLTLDNRVKGITLVVAYNDGDTDHVRYIVNHGADWMGPAGTSSSTSFDASALPSGWTSATLTTVAHSSTDGTYTFNGNNITGTSLGSGTYLKNNQFNLTGALNAGSTNTLGYTAIGSSFKSTIAVLKARYVTAPTANFTMSIGDSITNPASVNMPVTFTSTSTIPNTDNGATYAWSFGDGNTSTAQNPTNVYSASGNYTATLTVTNEGGSSTATKTVYVTSKPIISFSPVSETVNPAGTTTYTITMDSAPSGLSGYDMYVTVDSSVATITAVSYPSSLTPLITPSVPVGKVRISAADTNQNIYPGTSGPYTLATITVKGIATGSSDISLSGLTMDDDAGNAIDAVLKTGTIFVGSYDGPSAAFSANATSGNSPLTVAFDSSTSTGSITTYQWDFNNDGTIDSTSANPTYTYSAIGTYSVKLTVSGPGGSNTQLKNAYITVGDGVAPTVTLNADKTSGLYPLTVKFNTTTTGNVASYLWVFSDNSTSTTLATSTLATPTYTFTYPGTFNARVTVTGTGGSASDSKTIIASQDLPVAGIVANPTSGTGPLTVQFTDASTGTFSSWNWSFGDGSYSDEQSPSHEYTSAGIYNVTHTVSGSAGTSDPAATTTITVTGLGVSFTSNVTTGVASAEHALPATFTSTVTGAGVGATYLWDFGDGSNSTEANPVHNYYGHLKSFTVSLTVTSGVDVASVTKTAYITTTPYIEASPKYDSTGSITGYYSSVPADLDGDYVYEDINHNGRVDYVDVVAFYDAYEMPSIAGDWFVTNTDVDNAYDYDYNGNGFLDFSDIVALHDKILYS